MQRFVGNLLLRGFHLTARNNTVWLDFVDIVSDCAIVEGIEKSQIDRAVLCEQLLDLRLVVGKQPGIAGDIDVIALTANQMPLFV